jgi:hypothetical protein
VVIISVNIPHTYSHAIMSSNKKNTPTGIAKNLVILFAIGIKLSQI